MKKDTYWEDNGKGLDSLEDLMVKVITKDKELQAVLATKVGQALKTVDFTKIIKANIEETINCVFEHDDFFEMIDKAVKEELTKAITKHFDKP